ncbi:DUF1189 domain-containing protein [Bacillaceae bacterium Marseille-Q3522]|nr:DUF1189 domain-containing protein [Bacillaceae bacterium Marseille-Q3522]
MNIFKQFYKSFYSPKDLAAFRFQGIGKTILYVFFIAFLTVLPSLIYFNNAFINGISDLQQSLENDLPDFSISNGELTAESDVPVISKQDTITIIIDDTGTIEEDDLEDYDHAIALLKNNPYFVTNGIVQPYFTYDFFQINKNNLTEITGNLDSFLWILIPFISLVSILFSSAFKFIEVTFLALLGMLIINPIRRKASYRQLWRMSAYSITLPAVFFMIMDALQTKVPNGLYIYWTVAFIILLLSIKELPPSRQ